MVVRRNRHEVSTQPAARGAYSASTVHDSQVKSPGVPSRRPALAATAAKQMANSPAGRWSTGGPNSHRRHRGLGASTSGIVHPGPYQGQGRHPDARTSASTRERLFGAIPGVRHTGGGPQIIRALAFEPSATEEDSCSGPTAAASPCWARGRHTTRCSAQRVSHDRGRYGRVVAAVQQTPLPSKEEINRCGFYLAELYRGDAGVEFDQERFDRALHVVSDYRAAHGYPLGKVTMGLRSMVHSEGGAIVVSQRLKRYPRIVRKLARMGNSKLARLEDVGGCRAVLASPDELERVFRRVRRRWTTNIVRERDYIQHSNEIGYRAKHLVVERDSRRIEVQLRTQTQHDWAEAIEQVDNRLQLTLKDGQGPPEMIEFFSVASEVRHRLEYGLDLADDLVERLRAARSAVVDKGYYSR